MKIGVIGLGTVGFGAVEILTQQKERLEKQIGEEVIVKYGCSLDEVTLPEEALQFILKQDMFAKFGGYDLDTMSQDEIIDMANDIAQFIKMIAKRHK